MNRQDVAIVEAAMLYYLRAMELMELPDDMPREVVVSRLAAAFRRASEVMDAAVSCNNSGEGK